jgi:hypothetical protein
MTQVWEIVFSYHSCFICAWSQTNFR